MRQTRTIDAQLQVGTAIARVEVQGTAQALDNSNAEIAGVLQSRQVNDIPINGRDWATLMTLAPGAVNLGGGGQRDIRFVGRGIDDSNYTFDGIDATGVQEQSQKGGRPLEHFAGNDRGVPREFLSLYRRKRRVGRSPNQRRFEVGDERISRRSFRVLAQRYI